MKALLDRAQLAICGGLLGAIAGLLGAALLWEYIYALGVRVVSDETYHELLVIVRYWGILAGACSGIAVVIGTRKPSIVFVSLHVLALIAGVTASGYGWLAGIGTYLGTHVLFFLCSLGLGLGSLSRTGHRDDRSQARRPI